MTKKLAKAFIVVGFYLCYSLGAEISLLERYPFGAFRDEEPEKDLIVQKIPDVLEAFEFCGSSSFGKERRFSVFSKLEDRRRWIVLNETIGEYKFVQYRENMRALLVDYQGKVGILPLRERSQIVTVNRSLNVKRLRKDSPKQKSRMREPRRRIVPKDERPPRVMPRLPKLPEKLPAPPQRV